MINKGVFVRTKKSEQENITPMWIILFVAVAFVIAGSVSVVYSTSVDIRSLENEAFLNRMEDCLVKNGLLNEEVFYENFDIYSFCSLNKKVFEEEGVYYFNLEFYNSRDILINRIKENPLRTGDFSFQKECAITGSEIKVREGIACLSDKTDFLFYENKELKKGYFRILIASNNQGKKIPLN